VIASACRTPIGKYGRALRNVEAVKLGSIAIAEAVARSGLHGADVEEVIMGNVISAGLGQAPARQAALLAGLPDRGGNREQGVRVRDRATNLWPHTAPLQNYPHEFPEGIEWVLVNGTVAVADGRPTGALAGRVLRRPRVHR